MNGESLLAISSVVACVVIGAFVFFRSPKALANRLFGLLSGLCTFQCLVEFGYFQSRSFEQASFWWRMDVVWYLSLATLLYLVIVLSSREYLLKKIWPHLLILLPAAVFVVMDIRVSKITSPPIEHKWG